MILVRALHKAEQSGFKRGLDQSHQRACAFEESWRILLWPFMQWNLTERTVMSIILLTFK